MAKKKSIKSEICCHKLYKADTKNMQYIMANIKVEPIKHGYKHRMQVRHDMKHRHMTNSQKKKMGYVDIEIWRNKYTCIYAYDIYNAYQNSLSLRYIF